MPKYSQCLHDREVIMYIGSLSQRERGNILDTIKKSKEPLIMMTTFTMGAVGYNWQMFDMVIFADRNWNPQVLHPHTLRKHTITLR